MWRIDDLDIRAAVQFIPDGEPLPVFARPRWALQYDAAGVPTSMRWSGPPSDAETDRVRAQIAAEADTRTQVADGRAP